MSTTTEVVDNAKKLLIDLALSDEEAHAAAVIAQQIPGFLHICISPFIAAGAIQDGKRGLLISQAALALSLQLIGAAENRLNELESDEKRRVMGAPDQFDQW